MQTKKMDFAGTWYPATAAECEKAIDDYLGQGEFAHHTAPKYTACISPHAGWYFSGKIACNVISHLATEEKTDVVVLFGKHLHSRSAATILKNCSLETPFGTLDVDDNFSSELAGKLDLIEESADMLGADNTIELQLPFIKYFFKDADLVVIGTPLNDLSSEIGKTVAHTARDSGLNIKIIGSTDMTHYGESFAFTPAGGGSQAFEWVKTENDQKMIDAMIKMNGGRIIKEARENRNACCGGAVAATVEAARELGAQEGKFVAYSNSYDLSPGDSFVGYGGVLY